MRPDPYVCQEKNDGCTIIICPVNHNFVLKFVFHFTDAHTPVMKLDVPNDDETTHEAWSSGDTSKPGFLTIK